MSACIAILADDPGFRTSLCAALTAAGYEPVTLIAGIGVHEILRDLAPYAIILDVPHDPSASTLHWPALAALAHKGALRHTPLLACLPEGDVAAARRVAALALPWYEVLSKPLAPECVLTHLERLSGADGTALGSP